MPLDSMITQASAHGGEAERRRISGVWPHRSNRSGGRLNAAVAECALRLKSLPAWGFAMTKEMLNRTASVDYVTAIDMEAWTQSMLMAGEDLKRFHGSFFGQASLVRAAGVRLRSICYGLRC
jgi:hypothetical protein